MATRIDDERQLQIARPTEDIDILFAANGQTSESLQPHIRRIMVDGVEIRTLDIEGLLKTKTGYRDKDRLDRDVLTRIGQQL